MLHREFNTGRQFAGRFNHAKDLLASLTAFADEHNINMAVFSAIGAVFSATLGYYDQSTKDYVTYRENTPLEIISCTGNISLKEGMPFVHAHAVLSDGKGRTTGGHLFSETPVFAGEFYIRELTGSPFSRFYDETTGLMLWSNET